MTDKDRAVTVIDRLDQIPTTFASEEEEAAFWETHEMSAELWHSLPGVPDDLLPPIRQEAPHSEKRTG